MMIKGLFFQAVQRYTADESLILSLWNDIEKRYSGSGRHYHNLAHLDNLAKELLPYKDRFMHWDAVVFAIAYHDVIYNVLKQNSEERSADYAEEKLALLPLPVDGSQKCRAMILATKSHQVSDDAEINLFTDADLSILGADEQAYTTYFQQIRKEYSIYPGLVYWPGRKKVLQHFLEMKRIFKTDAFFHRYEEQARKNLESEIRFIEGKSL
jgi:predicted metal-dependent HD superfamily phosphohydrolase